MSEPTTTTNDALTDLAGKINDSHHKCLKALRNSLEFARETGNLLLEAKQKAEEAGERWLPWVQTHCKFSISEAQRYMRIANHYNTLREKRLDLDKLSMTEALRMLSPTAGKAASGSQASARPIRVSSRDEIKRLTRKAAELRFADDSAHKKFVQEKAAGLARQVLALAAKCDLKGGQEDPLSPAEVAVALLEQLKKALTLELVVEVVQAQENESEPATQEQDGDGDRNETAAAVGV